MTLKEAQCTWDGQESDYRDNVEDVYIWTITGNDISLGQFIDEVLDEHQKELIGCLDI